MLNIKKINEANVSEKRQIAFEKWFETFLSEKDLDLDTAFEYDVKGATHIMTAWNVVSAIIQAPKNEQAGIKNMIVKIDFVNGDVLDYFKHLGQALANSYKGILAQ